jgi:hypothetical protein
MRYVGTVAFGQLGPASLSASQKLYRRLQVFNFYYYIAGKTGESISKPSSGLTGTGD